ncbi:hypothetical protein SAMN06265348_11732 [Pedobacter westerhofensis]|uniref:Nuclear transport factor 2 family protein n=1 Tax=Pedobacter westerhofensis TaxID=425512 RepID=A0A521FT05_9SPHI|nr:DUF1348 family protein [Pedobacter westerhofensis]SMO98631.1 hypothetical protein SAMN06265348_11732 [Pedobacter westerhofensis]
MKTLKYLPVPPWDMETAALRLKLLEDDFNSLDAKRISDNFTVEAEVRFGTHFLRGRGEIRKFIAADLATRNSYKLNLDLWGALKGRMALRFELEWSDADEKPYKSYGIQVFQFDDEGSITMNFVSFNDQELS